MIERLNEEWRTPKEGASKNRVGERERSVEKEGGDERVNSTLHYTGPLLSSTNPLPLLPLP